MTKVLSVMIFTFQRHVKLKVRHYGLLIPGSEIPKWLSHKNVGTSVNLQVPSSDLLCNRLMGIVLCVIFVFRQHHPFNHFIFLIEVIDIGMKFYVPYTPTNMKLAVRDFQYPRN